MYTANDWMNVSYWMGQLTGELDPDYPIAEVFAGLQKACKTVGVDLSERCGNLHDLEEQMNEELNRLL